MKGYLFSVCEIGEVVGLVFSLIVYGYFLCFEEKGYIRRDLMKLCVIEIVSD